MAEGTIGTVFVAVVPSTKGFGAKAKKQIEAEAAGLAAAASAAANKEMGKRGGLIDASSLFPYGQDISGRQKKMIQQKWREYERLENAKAREALRTMQAHDRDALRQQQQTARTAEKIAREQERSERQRVRRQVRMHREGVAQMLKAERDMLDTRRRISAMDPSRQMADGSFYDRSQITKTLDQAERDLQRAVANRPNAGNIGRNFIDQAFNPQDMGHQVGRQMSNAGRRMTFSGSAAAALPIAAAGYFAAKFESELGRTMSVVQGGKFFGDAGQTDRLRQAAMAVSRDNPFTNIDVAQGMSELARAGLSYNQVLAGIEPATDIAIAGQMDLATASHTVAAAMGQFQLGAKDIPRIGDAMAVAANRSNASLQDLALSMEYVGPVAGSAGISLEETNAMLGLLGKQGIIASKAGTTLRSAFMSLASPTEQNKALMKDLGINIAYTSGKMKGQIKPLASIADELHRATKNMTQAEKQDFLGSMFGKYGSAAGRILAQGGDELRKFVNEIENSSGAAKELAERSMSPLELAFRKLQGSVENFLVTFGNAMAPALMAVANGLAAITEAASRLPDGALIALGTGLTAVALAGPALWAAGGTIAGLRAVVGVARAAGIALAGLGAINVLAGGAKGGKAGGIAYLAKSLGSIDFAAMLRSGIKKSVIASIGLSLWDGLALGWNNAQASDPLEVKSPETKKAERYLAKGFRSDALQNVDTSGWESFKQTLGSIWSLLGDIVDLAMTFPKIVGEAVGMLSGVSFGNIFENINPTMFFASITAGINQARIGITSLRAEALEAFAQFYDAADFVLPGDFSGFTDSLRKQANEAYGEIESLQRENRELDLEIAMSMLPEGDQVKIDKALAAAEQAVKQTENWAAKQTLKIEMKTALVVNKAAGKVFKGAGLDAFGLGVPDSKIRAKYAKQRQALDQEMNKGGGPKVAIQPKSGQGKKAVEKSINTGKPVSIKVQAKLDDAKSKIKSLRQQLGSLDQGKKGRVNVKANVQGRGEVRDLKQALKGLKNERVKVNVGGADAGKKDVADLIAELEKLKGKNPNTVTVKQEGANEAAAEVSNLIVKLAALDSMAPVVTVSIQADTSGYYAALASLPSSAPVPEGRSFAPPPPSGDEGGGIAPATFGATAFGASEDDLSATTFQTRAFTSTSTSSTSTRGGKKGSSGGLGGILDEIVRFSKALQGMGVNAIKDGMDAIKKAIGNRKWGDDAKKQIDKQMEDLRQTLQKRTDKLKAIYENFFAELTGNAIDPRWLGRDGDADSLASAFQGVEDNLVLAVEKLNGKGLEKAQRKAEKERRKRLQKTVRAYRKEARDQIKELRNIEAARDFRDEIKESAQTSADLSRVRSGAGLSSYLARMTTALTDARSGVEALATKGLPLNLLQQIMRQDPQTAAKWVKRLQAMPQADFDALKAKWNSYQQAGANYASYGTNAVFGDTVGTSFEDGLLAREAQIKEFFNKMGVAIAESFEIALGMDNTRWKNAPAQKHLRRQVDSRAQNRTPRGAGNRHGGPRDDNGKRGDNVTVNVHAGASESAQDLARKTSRELTWKQKKRRNRR